MQESTIATDAQAVSRLANPLDLVPELRDVTGALFKVTGNGSIPPTTISLVQLRAGQIVGNTYLTVQHAAHLRKAAESEEWITVVASWQDAPYFTDAQRVALALVDAVLQPPVPLPGVSVAKQWRPVE